MLHEEADMKTLEQRLYEAYRKGRGLMLSADDVDSLVFDDAIGTRISNEAAEQAGAEPPGADSVWPKGIAPTWRDFVSAFRKAET